MAMSFSFTNVVKLIDLLDIPKRYVTSLLCHKSCSLPSRD